MFLLLLVTVIESAVKCLMFSRKPFFAWSAEMVVARWNFAGSGSATPVVHEHCTKAQNGTRVKKSLGITALIYIILIWNVFGMHAIK